MLIVQWTSVSRHSMPALECAEISDSGILKNFLFVNPWTRNIWDKTTRWVQHSIMLQTSPKHSVNDKMKISFQCFTLSWIRMVVWMTQEFEEKYSWVSIICLFYKYFQEVMMRRRPPPPTKEGNTGDRLDTNTFISHNGTLNGKSPHGTLRTPTKGYHSPHVSTNNFQNSSSTSFISNTHS